MQIFLHSNFSLEDLPTFNAVLPWSSIHGGVKEAPSRPMSPKKSRKLLQEKVIHLILNAFLLILNEG